jgi:hypothetical protein
VAGAMRRREASVPSKASVAGNSVVAAVEEACAIYGVRCYRMQSRAVTVVGAGGRPRPMFMGQWRDKEGKLYYGGMPDLLLTPVLTFDDDERVCADGVAVTLWVECKAGTGRLGTEQQAFKEDVEEAGAFYIECRDSADSVIRWFEAYDVKRG